MLQIHYDRIGKYPRLEAFRDTLPDYLAAGKEASAGPGCAGGTATRVAGRSSEMTGTASAKRGPSAGTAEGGPDGGIARSSLRSVQRARGALSPQLSLVRPV